MRWLLVILAAALLAVGAACGGSSESTPTPNSNAGNAAQVSGGQLTDNAKQKLEQIVRADPTIAEIAGNIQSRT